MQAEAVYSSDLKFNLEVWKRELKFHLSELNLFRDKLTEIAGREMSSECSMELEKFQNRILIEKDAISKLLHRCRAKLGTIHSADLYNNVDGKAEYERRELNEDLKHYIKLHYEYKEAMMDFLSKWL